jgi:hypothetical protein
MALAAAEVKRRIRLFLGLAGEARVIAETMHDLKSRRAMLFIAASYESMAKNLENAAEHLSPPMHSARGFPVSGTSSSSPSA